MMKYKYGITINEIIHPNKRMADMHIMVFAIFLPNGLLLAYRGSKDQAEIYVNMLVEFIDNLLYSKEYAVVKK